MGESIRLYGEAGDVNISDIAPMMRELRVFLVVYDPANIFNMDESGLFYRAMPARTYLAANESRRTVRGTKALKAKDRVTVVFCCNATGKNTGTLGYQLFVFGNLYIFKERVRSTHLFSVQPKLHTISGMPHVNFRTSIRKTLGWMQVFIGTGGSKFFLPAVRAWTSEPVALLMDNFSGHDDQCVDTDG